MAMFFLTLLAVSCNASHAVRRPSVADYEMMSDARLCSAVLNRDRTVRLARAARGLSC